MLAMAAVLAASLLEGHTLVLSYDDFAPQAACHELIGFEWNQWKSEGHPEPDDVPVKVVVYRNAPLRHVQKAYPVVRGTSDHRYVRYDRARKFLDEQLRSETARQFPELIARYQKTKRALEQHAWTP